MRILVITNLFPPHALGGYERVCADVVRLWRAGGHDVAVLTSTYRLPGVASADADGIERALRATSLYGHAALPHRRAGAERAARRVVDDAVDRNKPDAALVWNAAGLPLSAIRRLHERGVPTQFVVADTWPVRAEHRDPWVSLFGRSRGLKLLAPLVAAFSRVPTTVPQWDSLGRWAFCSIALRQEIVEATGQPFRDSVVLPLGVDTEDFPIGTAPDEPRPWRWRLLFVGRLEEAKGIDTLVRALVELPPEATLDVCAPDEPEHMARLRRLAADLGVTDRIRIQALSRDLLAPRYRTADVCVFPSEWAEPFGIVPLEAMACSTPVVASATGGSAEYLRDGDNCVVATPGDPAAIAAAVRRLADDSALRARIVDTGKATAASLTIERLAASLETLVLDLTRSTTRTPG